jgi:hypothetical protein
MLLLGKLALGIVSTVAVATVYTFREGLITVKVDEYRDGGSHVHLWVPAAMVPAVMHFVPKNKLGDAPAQLNEWLPTVRQLTKEVKKYPDAEFINVEDEKEHVVIRTEGGKVRIDVTGPGEDVHVSVPIDTIEDLSEEFSTGRPGA